MSNIIEKIEVRQAINKAIADTMTNDENIFLMGEEVAEYNGAYKVSAGLLEKFGSKRVIDTPITEHGFTGLAIGAAFAGLRPIVEFMTFNFSMQAIDQIINSAAKTNYMSGGQISCPIVFRGPNGAAARVGAQHSQSFASWYAHVPGLKVIAPYSVNDTYALMKAAILDNSPIIFLENEVLYNYTGDFDPNYIAEIGKAKIVQEGSDITFISYSITMDITMQAAEILKEKHNLSVEIIDLRSLRPLDTDTVIKSLKKTGKGMVIEESWPCASIASEIIAVAMEEAFDYLDAPIQRVCSKDVPLPYAKNLEKLALPRVEDILEKMKEIMLL